MSGPSWVTSAPSATWTTTRSSPSPRGSLPVVHFAAGGVAMPADAALMMQLGCDGVFVGSGILKSGDPARRARAIVQAVTNYNDPEVLAEISCGLGEAMVERFAMVSISTTPRSREVKCVQALHRWRDTSSEVNDELLKGYRQGNVKKNINEIVAGYDFSNSNNINFNVSIWYNSSYRNDTGFSSPALVSNAYIQYLRTGAMMQFEYVKEMPQPARKIRLDFSSLLCPLFFTWVIQLLFPVILQYLVYENQKKLKILMKMHGLKDGPYWMISYAYFLFLSSAYMLFFVIFGSVIGMNSQSFISL